MSGFKRIRPLLVVSLILIFSFAVYSCSTPRKTGFALQKEIWEMDVEYGLIDTSAKEIYLKGTLPIDSADPEMLIYDIYRVEPYDYPKEIRLITRVFDSSCYFITNMGDPYRKDPNITYFTSIREDLGKHYNIRQEGISEFKVREYGANDSIAYNIVLTVDYSGSMDAILDAIFIGTELFVSMKFDVDRIALATFNKDVDVKVPLMKDTVDILRTYRANYRRGIGLFSAMKDAVWASYDILKDTPVEDPRVVVVLSDGDDNYSKTSLDSLIRRANRDKIHVFCVAFGYSKDESMRYLAQYTGGKYYKAYTKEQLIDIFRDIYLSLRYFYKITYTPPVYWGYHHVYSGLNVPGRVDSLIGEGFYDTSGWLALSDTIIRPIFFDFDRSEIKPESYQTLDELVDLMMSWPRLRFDIHGHTDNIGTIEYNQALSERRAQAVFDALIQRGIEERRLRFRGFGMSKPVASNETEAGRSQNRRTEFIIIAK